MSGDFCQLPKCREATVSDKLLLAIWKDAGHINKAGVSYFTSKKQYSQTPLVNGQLNSRKTGNAAHELA